MQVIFGFNPSVFNPPAIQDDNTLTKTVSTDSVNHILDQIPHRYHNEIHDDYIRSIESTQMSLVEQIRKDPNNCLLRFKFAQNSLLLAEICRYLAQQKDNQANELFHIEEEKAYIEKAKHENLQGWKGNKFHSLYYYTESMIAEYEGVDCKNIEAVVRYTKLLLTAKALDPDSNEIKEKLDQVLHFLNKRWAELQKNHTIDALTYANWILLLNFWVSEDPLKVLFTDHPDYFKYVQLPKYSTFLNEHPQFKNIEAFKEYYPNAGFIYLPGNDVTKDVVQKTLLAVKSHPLATKFAIIHEAPVVTADVADEIKTGMLDYFLIGKRLTIYVGNKKDVDLVNQSFQADSTLSQSTGSLTTKELKMEGFTHPIYVISIEKPYLKTQ